MSATRVLTKYAGVYQRASEERRFEGKPDLCFDITYKIGGRKVWEKVGWRSEGYTASMASQIRAERMRSTRHGDMPQIVARGKAEFTLGEAWKSYDELRLAKIKRPSTDRGRWKLHLAYLANQPVSALTPMVLERLKTDLAQKGLSPQTARHVLTLLGRAINHAMRLHLWVGENPLLAVRMPSVDNKRFRFLSPDEAQRLLAAIRERSEDSWRICMMSLHTGMRFGEIAALRWECVDLSANLVQVLDPKNGSSRTVPINNAVCKMLRGVLATPGLVFPAARGKAVSEENRVRAAQEAGLKARVAISTAFARAVDRLGLNDGVVDRRGKIVFHTLRHTYASWLAMSGVPLYQLMELMGHRSIEMTKRYASLCPAQGKAANERIACMLEQVSTPDSAVHTSSADAHG